MRMGCIGITRAMATCQEAPSVTRRAALGALSAALVLRPSPSNARVPPSGYRVHVDKLDGYSLFYPEDWIVVTTSGNDILYRNPRNLDENLFVEVRTSGNIRGLGVPQ